MLFVVSLLMWFALSVPVSLLLGHVIARASVDGPPVLAGKMRRDGLQLVHG